MSTYAVTITYTHTVTYVTAKLLLTLKDIIRRIGLDPAHFSEEWSLHERGVSAWLNSRQLRRITLEVYKLSNDQLVTRWDIDIVYSTVGDGSMWVDTDAIRYAIAKAGTVPSLCRYDVIYDNAPGALVVPGFKSCHLRDTGSMTRRALGATIGASGLSAKTAYWTS